MSRFKGRKPEVSTSFQRPELTIKERTEAKENAYIQMTSNFWNQSLEAAYSVLGSFHLFIDDAYLFRVRDQIYNSIIKDHDDALSIELVEVPPSINYPSGFKAKLETPGKRSYHLDHIIGNERLTMTARNDIGPHSKSSLSSISNTMTQYINSVFERIDKIIDHLDSEK